MLPLNDENLTRGAILRSELKTLADETVEMNRYRDYFDGEQPLAYSTALFQEVFGDAFIGFKDNWMKVIVNAVNRRLKLTNFNFDDDGEPGDENTLASQVWEVMRLNDIEVQQKDHHEGAMVEGRSFIIVWPDETIGATVDWQPGQLCRVFYDPDRRTEALWAVKRWSTETGDVYVTFYTPNFVYKFVDRNGDLVKANDPSSSSALTEIPEIGYFGGDLEERRVGDEPWPLPNPYGIVPVIEFNNTSYQSELHGHLEQQDALNKTLLDQIVAGEFAAFPQRVVETSSNAPIGGWISGPGEVWHFKPSFDADGKQVNTQFTTFDTADPQQYIEPIRMWLEHIALTSETPVRYFLQVDRGGRGDAPSGDSLLVDDKPLNDKVEDKQDRFGNAWMRVARLIAASLGVDSWQSLTGEAVWRDPRHDYRLSRLEEGKVMADTGIPISFIAKHLGFSPADEAELLAIIEQEKAEQEVREERAFEAASANQESSSDSSDS